MGARYPDTSIVIVLHGSRLHVIKYGRVAKIRNENITEL